MAKTYAQIEKQIEKLHAEASALRAAELKGVISRINGAIAVYGITPADLAFDGKKKSTPSGESKLSRAPRPIGTARQYADGAGNTWTGRGPRPQWLRDVLASGGDISKLVVTGKSTAAPTHPAAKPAEKAKSSVPTKYRDLATGSVWSGRGSKPTWLRVALDSGRKIEEFTVAAAASANGSGAAAPTKKLAKAKKAKVKAQKVTAPKRSMPQKPLADSLNGAGAAKH